MHEYDAALKVLLQNSGGIALNRLGGGNIVRWLNVEMQQVSVSRADLVGQTASGEILQIELQATNDPHMALRMAEYGLDILRQFKIFPRQIVLYVGEKKLNMPAAIDAKDQMAFKYTLLDIRDFTTEELLASSRIEDNLLAILTNLQNQTAVIQTVLGKIAHLDDAARRNALAQLLVISGLRRLGHTIKEEVQKMPVLNDLLDHDLLGPLILQGRREGLEKGRKEGLQEGLQEGLEEGRKEAGQAMLRRIFETRLGAVPAWVEQRLTSLSADQTVKMVVKAVQAASYEELFP